MFLTKKNCAPEDQKRAPEGGGAPQFENLCIIETEYMQAKLNMLQLPTSSFNNNNHHMSSIGMQTSSLNFITYAEKAAGAT
jgi:glutathione peroxidase-family protein